MEFKPYPKAKTMSRRNRKSERAQIFCYNKKLRKMKRKEKEKEKLTKD